MALISCRECNKEISDQAKSCPHCGCPSRELENIDSPNIQKVEVASVSLGKPKNLKKIIFGLVLVFFVVATIFVVKYQQQLKEQQAQMEAKQEYTENLRMLNTTSLYGAADAEKLCNLTKSVWYNTIYEESNSTTDKYTKTGRTFNDDFNDSLRNLFADKSTIKTIDEIKMNQSEVDRIYKLLQNPSKELEACFKVTEDLYSIYRKLTNLAIDPSGNLSSYSDNASEYASTFIELYNKLDMLIPEDVSIPTE